MAAEVPVAPEMRPPSPPQTRSEPGSRAAPRSCLALRVSPQALPYVCLLIAMLFFIYAIIGMQVGALMGPGEAGRWSRSPNGTRDRATLGELCYEAYTVFGTL